MIKVRTTNGQVVLGLSEENIKRLKQGKPISFNLSALAMPPCPVMIFYGKTEDAMLEELRKAGMCMDPTMLEPGGKLNG